MTCRNLLAVFIGAIALAGCSAAPASESGQDNPAAQAGDRVTSILNAGVSADMGELKFMFDPLYDNHFGSLAEMDQALIEAIISGSAPYDDVDAVFVSHAHGDHFSAEYLNRLMAAQEGMQVIAPGQAIADMKEHELWQDRFEGRVIAIELRNGEAAERFEVAGATVEALRTPHSGWPDRHADVHNITFRVAATGSGGAPVRVMHMGDADPALQHFAMNTRFFCCARTNVVVLPFWFFREENVGTLIDRTLNAQKAVGVHVPTEAPGWLTRSGRDYFTRAGQQVPIAPPANATP